MATKQNGAAWRTQESRSVRPFRSAEDYLKDAGLRLYNDEDFRLAESIQVDAVDVAKLAVAVRIPPVPPDFDDVVGIPPSALQLIVSLEDRLYKDSMVATKIPLHEIRSARVIEIESETTEALSWAGDIRIHVAVVLAEPRKGEIGTAQRVGSWVARKSFSVGMPRETASFTINAVDPNYFEQRGLPRTTTYLVEVHDTDLNQSCEFLPDLVKVSLAKDVHSALARDEASAMSKAIIKAIYVDVVTTVLVAGYSGLTGKIQDDTILDVVTTRLEKETGVAPDRLWKLAKEPGAANLRAVVQGSADFSRALVSAAQPRTL
jgi:hypothetical protein